MGRLQPDRADPVNKKVSSLAGTKEETFVVPPNF
jgi:hypothetical protein